MIQFCSAIKVTPLNKSPITPIKINKLYILSGFQIFLLTTYFLSDKSFSLLKSISLVLFVILFINFPLNQIRIIGN